MSDITIEHEGDEYLPYEPGQWWQHSWTSLTDDEAAARRKIVNGGTFLVDGAPMPEGRARFERAKILGTHKSQSAPYDPTEAGPVRDYVPGLWTHGTIPMLGGPPKVGKSAFVLQLAASLVTPGRRFLDHFSPAEMLESERSRNVWLLNAENPPQMVHAILRRLGLEYDNFERPFYYDPAASEDVGVLFVEHLEALGGADTFDLSSAEVRDYWTYRLMEPSEGEFPPLTVIADGMTAMLNSDTHGYGKWFAGFRKTLNAIDVPNGLAIGHHGMSTGYMMQGSESVGGPDGTWMYEAKSPDRSPNAARWFSTSKRLDTPGVDRSRVAIDSGGLLSLVSTDTRELPQREHERDPFTDQGRASRIRDLLHGAAGAGLWGTEVTGRGQDGLANKRVLLGMVEAGTVVSRAVQNGRTRGTRYWLAAFATPA